MKHVPDGYKMVSFDLKSLFTYVPLEKTVDIILKRIYERKEINTSISKKEMKQLLTLFTKNIHFTIIKFINKRWGCYEVITGASLVRNIYGRT